MPCPPRPCLVWSTSICAFVKLSCSQNDRKTDEQTDRRTDRQTNRQTDEQTDRRTDRRTDRQTNRQTDEQTDRRTERSRYCGSLGRVIKCNINCREFVPSQELMQTDAHRQSTSKLLLLIQLADALLTNNSTQLTIANQNIN